MARWPELDWGTIYKRLVLYAARCLGRQRSLAAAEDLAQTAIRAALERLEQPGVPRPASEDDMTRWIGAFVANLSRNQRRSAAERLTEPLPERFEGAADDDAEALVAGHEHQRRVVAAARHHSDAVALAVLDCFVRGIVGRTEQAAELGYVQSQVDQARYRIRTRYLAQAEVGAEP